MPKIKDLPDSERPREKLLRQGRKKLSNTELLSLIIGSGTSTTSALELASKVLSHTGEYLESLKDISPEELTRIAGIGEATAARILASVEFGARITSAGAMRRTKILSADDVAEMFVPDFVGEKQEYLYTVLLNAKHEVISKELITKGGVTSSPAIPQDVFRPAIKRGAAAIILVHNHPSGDPEPSENDCAITSRICEAGKLIGIRLIDHIVVGTGGAYASLRAFGVLGTE